MRWLLRTILMLLVVGALMLTLAVGPLFLQDAPILEASGPPTPQDVVATRQLVHDIRAAAGEDQESNAVLHADAAQLNSAIRLGSRFIDGFRGRVTIDASEVLGEISMPVPWWRGQKWLNISGRVPEFDQQFSLSRITVGATSLPPALAIAMARTGANIGIGHRFGDKILQTATAMKITGDVLTFRIDLDDVGKNGVMRGAFGTLRGREMPAPDVIETYHQRIREAIEQGTLSQTGNLLPYLRFALQAALENSTAKTLPDAYTAAVFGLAKACGAKDLAMIVGRLAFDTATAAGEWSTNCNDVTFNNRIDSRRHFITSAALQAASNTGVAVSIGEFKELHDIISGAGGFDFTDLAANLSGIRMSNVLMAAPMDAWPSLLERMQVEHDVIVPFDGIPQIMPEAEFKAQFGDVDSPQYKAMLAMIKARIDQLALYREK